MLYTKCSRFQEAKAGIHWPAGLTFRIKKLGNKRINFWNLYILRSKAQQHH